MTPTMTTTRQYHAWFHTLSKKGLAVSNNEKRHRVAVYGTLKGMDRGGRWNGKNGAIVYLGRAYTADPDYEMWGGSFPVVIRSPDGPNKGHVLCEVYDVSGDVLHQLDLYEGAPVLYMSEPVSLRMEKDGSDEVATMYFGNSIRGSLKSRPIIKPDGGVLYWPFPAEYRPEAIV